MAYMATTSLARLSSVHPAARAIQASGSTCLACLATARQTHTRRRVASTPLDAAQRRSYASEAKQAKDAPMQPDQSSGDSSPELRASPTDDAVTTRLFREREEPGTANQDVPPTSEANIPTLLSDTQLPSDASGASPTGATRPTSSSARARPSQLSASLEQTKALAISRFHQVRLATFKRMAKQQEELSKRLSEAGSKINDVTGYREIERLKREVTRQELELMAAREEAKLSKERHAMALNEKMTSSREVNDLLQRKASWLDSDVLRFTQLVREDHGNESRERDFKIESDRNEERVEKKIGEMMQAILRRYHEEQVWSDKVRSLSTYGSLGITAINILVFLLALSLVEPYKRRRMVNEVEARIKSHDTEARTALEGQFLELKGLMSAFAGTAALPGSQGTSEVTGSSGCDRELSAHLAAEELVSADMENETSAHAMLEAEASRSSLPGRADEADDGQGGTVHETGTLAKEQHKRDVAYIGVAGTLLGAGVVTALRALFS